jgi:hypothetical protein
MGANASTALPRVRRHHGPHPSIPNP